jgi:hypothetical protein
MIGRLFTIKLSKICLLTGFILFNSGLFAQKEIRIKGLTIKEFHLQDKWRMKTEGTGDSAMCTYDVAFQIYHGKGKARKLAEGLNQLMDNAITTDTAHQDLPLEKRIEQDAKEFREEWERLNSDPESAWTFNYSKEQRFALIHANKNYVSIKDQAYYFTGGAHGFRVTVYTLLDAKKGTPVETWKSLFKDTSAVLKIAEETFRKSKNIPEAEPTSKNWFWNGKFYLPDNFAYTEKGIVFFYNVYEIAPPASGETELLLEYTTLGKLLSKPDQP